MASASDLFSQGIEIATMAVGYDTAGNYQEARALYFKAAEILHRLSNAEVNPERKQAFRDKATHYVSRVEQLNAVLGIEAAAATTSPDKQSRWQRQEGYGDRSYKQARTLHEERDVRQAVQEYKKAMDHYVDASREADLAGQHRIRDKWTMCCTAAERISSVLNQIFHKGPETVIDASTRREGTEDEEPPAVPTSIPTTSMGKKGGHDDPPDDDDDSFDALQARLARLKK